MLLRSAILFASENRILRHWMEKSASARPLTRRFVAGSSLEEAIAAIRELSANGLMSSLDALGESVTNETEAANCSQAYIESIQRISLLGLPATISLKLTQLGLDLAPAIARANLERIVETGADAGVRVEIDMEASQYVDATIDLLVHCHRRRGNVRGVIQAYLYRSETDIERLSKERIPIRLCKGAYKEEPDVAFPNKHDVDANFRKLTTMLLQAGTFPAIASHDEEMVAHAESEIARLKLAPEQYEFQMLYGIRRDLQTKLAEHGHPVRIYVPYGEAWYPYLMRRMAERPANLLFVLRNSLRS